MNKSVFRCTVDIEVEKTVEADTRVKLLEEKMGMKK